MQFSLVSKSLIILNPLVDRFNEGGPFFMSLILICLVLAMLCIIRGFLSLSKNEAQSKKMTRLAADAGLLGLVFGFLGSIIGLITAFDAIEGSDAMSSGLMASGLKISLLTTLFGSFVFIISRIGVMLLKWMHKA
jgi:hypothetical protein